MRGRFVAVPSGEVVYAHTVPMRRWAVWDSVALCSVVDEVTGARWRGSSFAALLLASRLNRGVPVPVRVVEVSS